MTGDTPPDPDPAAPEAAAPPPREPWPVEIRLKKADKRLEIDFDDGHGFSLPAELLRVESPSAEVQGHGPSQKILVAGKRPVGIIGIEAVGNYAIRILFDDLHNTGIFSWAYLYHLGIHQRDLWAAYLDALAARGLSRDPPHLSVKV